MKLLIIGHARHGKDTCAEILQEFFNMKFKSSSVAASEIFIYETLKEKYNYANALECFEDRVNHRAEWHDMICEYNKDDKARLAKSILEDADGYVGMRSGDEIRECVKQNIFDLIIWVDASERLPLEDRSSFNINHNYADVIIDNNCSQDRFREKVVALGGILFPKKTFPRQTVERLSAVNPN